MGLSPTHRRPAQANFHCNFAIATTRQRQISKPRKKLGISRKTITPIQLE